MWREVNRRVRELEDGGQMSWGKVLFWKMWKFQMTLA